jgi:ABC-type transport system involved in cytochrome bd biosynthesis fused ATPase/permease subunit
MAQTKRKRRSKHRGNAAGSIEARGRTGRKLTAEEQKQASRAGARGARERKPPSWSSAALKASAMAVILFVLVNFGVLGGKGSTSTSQAAFLAIMALVLYTPLAYVTDKWVYNRQQKSLAQKNG